MKQQNISNNIYNHYTYLDLDIRSFNKIELNPIWLKDITNLVFLYNLKAFIMKLKYIHKLYLLHRKKIFNVKQIGQRDISNKLVLKYQIYKLFELEYEFVQFLKLRRYLFKKLRIIRFPIRKPKINILKSPHVFKKAQDHYEIRAHKLVIKLPLLLINKSFIYDLLRKTSRLNSRYQVTLKRKDIYKLAKKQKL